MSPRRHLLPLLSALALLLAPFALAPRAAQAATVNILVDTLSDAAPTGTSCSTLETSDGDCSLRQALAKANSLPLADLKNISFELFTGGSLPISGPIVLSTAGNLPAITTSNVEIEADLGIDGLPRIEIDGNGKAVGFQISGSDNLIRGLSLYGFTNSGIEPFFGSAIYITGNNNDVQTSFIGVRPDGSVPGGKANFSGVRIDAGATGNVIGGAGGTVVANYISGNTQNGVIIRNASGNFVQNNVIGLVRSGSSLLLRGNGQYGVQVTSINGVSQNNIIGGGTTALANVIGGNGQAGVLLRGTGTTTTTIQANYIGIDKVTDTDFGNAGDGVAIEAGSSGNTLTGTASAPLIISGNTGYGVLLDSGGEGAPVNNRITGTVYIGTNRAGTGPVANTAGGVLIENQVRDTVIDGSGGSVRIAGNTGVGVTVRGTATTGTRIQSALVGLVPLTGADNPSQGVSNGGGVLIENARATSLIGNTISGNTGYGVRVTGGLTTTLATNFVGLSLNRKTVIGNGGPGVDIVNSRNTLIGGTGITANFVAGNGGPGIALSGTGATPTLSTTIRSNSLGLVQQAASTSYLERGPNSGEGVRVTGTVRQLIVDANNIAGAADTTATDFPGILVQGDNSVGPQGGLSSTNVATVTISSNRIGFMPTPTPTSSTFLPFPNAEGVWVSGRAQNVNILTNTIRLNVGAGVRVSDSLTVTIRANSPINRNLGGGIVAAGATRNLIVSSNVISESGKSPAGATIATVDGFLFDAGASQAAGLTLQSNSFFNNTGRGIALAAGAGSLTGAQILSNTLRTNAGLAITLQGDVNRATMRYNKLAQNGGAIDLVGATTYPGTGADPDTQATPNHGIDGPVVDLSFTNPLALRINQAGFIEGYVYTSTIRTESGLVPTSACITCTIQVFRPDTLTSTEGQGWELVRTVPELGGTARDQIVVPPLGNGRFAARVQGQLPRRLLFIATDGFGNSSEYVTLPLTGSLVLEPISPLATNAAPGDTVTYTLRLRNNGTVGYSNLRLFTGGTRTDWIPTQTPLPNTDFALAAGATRLVTVTLKLPTGANPNVAFGIKDTTLITITGSPPPVTATAKLETTVLPRPVISVTPRSSLGSGRPQTVVPHAFTIANNGNVTVTLNIAYTTVDPAASDGVWATSITSNSITLGPGRDARLGVSVTVPPGALQNVSATTYLTATLPASANPAYPAQTVLFSATTRTDLNANADIFPEVETTGAAEGQVTLTHNVENKSNGTARFCLDYFTAAQSRVRFESATSNFVIDAQGCFSLYAGADVNPAQGRFSLAQFRAIATVDRRLTTGNIETVTIFLRRGTPTGETVSDARVEDRIRVTAGLKLPRLWLPLIRNASPQ